MMLMTDCINTMVGDKMLYGSNKNYKIMCIFGRKLRQRANELEVEVATRNAVIENLSLVIDERDAEIERLKSELAKTPARGANGRYTNRKA